MSAATWFVDARDRRGASYRLQLRHFAGPGAALLLIHGTPENGRIFYSTGGRGLAPWLAQQGFDVHVADLRGHGASTPPVAAGQPFDQREIILEQLPLLIEAVLARRPDAPLGLVSHSWGGVLCAAALLRSAPLCARVGGLVHFATKRAITRRSLAKRLRYDLAWGVGGRLAVRLFGYLPARRLGLGADDETTACFRDTCVWADPRQPWVDPGDGFDYAAAARQIALPPTLWLAGVADDFLGHPSDVRRFMAECGQADAELRVLSRAAGQRHDYGHVDLLTHPDAPADHFPAVADWLHARLGARSP